MKAGQYRPASETPLKWRFAGGPIVARVITLAEINVNAILVLITSASSECSDEPAHPRSLVSYTQSWLRTK